MATKKPLRIGLIGYGFMGRTHSNAFRKVPNFFDLKYEPQLTAVCARNKDRAEAFASQWGYESVESDWRKLIDRDDIDVIDIAAPNNVHHEIAIAAAKATGTITVIQKSEKDKSKMIQVGENVLVIISENRTRVIRDVSK